MKFIFRKDQENTFYALYTIVEDTVDLQSKLGKPEVYNIIDCTDTQGNDVKSSKKRVGYDSDNNLIFEDANMLFPDLAGINGFAADLVEEGSAEKIACAQVWKQADFSSMTFPLNRSLGLISEDIGTTWVEDFYTL